MATNYPTYGATASNQARSNPWSNSQWGNQQQASPYGRGGGQQPPREGQPDPYPNVRQPVGTGPYNPNGGPESNPARPYTPPSEWSPSEYTTQPARPGGQSTYTPWTPTGLPAEPSGWNTQALRDQYSQYMSTMLPYQQYQQNNQQYSQDFNEAQRRWDEQFGWTQQGDRFNQDLSTRQQQMAEWTAQEASRQWENQFGWTQQNDVFNQNLASQQQQIDQAYNEGRLSNEQRQIALGELSQQQDEAFRRYQLGEQMGFSREELGATQQWRGQQDALARAQMAQEAQLAQAQIEQARQQALLQAYGRNQAPNAKWMRRG
jgi:hypothetical protein